MMILADALHTASRTLVAAGIETALLDARLLVGHVLGEETATLIAHPDRLLSEEESGRLAHLLQRRAAREPISHLLGKREFWSLDFTVTHATLDPRPDSETLVETVLRRTSNRAAPLRVLDLGTGTGCLLLSLLSELPNATGLGVDICPDALHVAHANAERLGFADRAAFRKGNWGHGIEETFDIIISNPPYIADAEIETLEPEVARYEPRRALSGGPDGLDAYRVLSAELGTLLSATGFAVIEMGAEQGADVARLFTASGLACEESVRDLAGHERCWIIAPQRTTHQHQPPTENHHYA